MSKKKPSKYGNQKVNLTTSKKKAFKILDECKLADEEKVRNGTHKWVDTPNRSKTLVRVPIGTYAP